MLVENVYLIIQLDDLLCKHVNVKLTRKLIMLHKVKMTRKNKGQNYKSKAPYIWTAKVHNSEHIINKIKNKGFDNVHEHNRDQV